MFELQKQNCVSTLLVHSRIFLTAESSYWIHFRSLYDNKNLYLSKSKYVFYLCKTLRSFLFLMGYSFWIFTNALWVPLSIRLLNAKWFSGSCNKERQTNILQLKCTLSQVTSLSCDNKHKHFCLVQAWTCTQKYLYFAGYSPNPFNKACRRFLFNPPGNSFYNIGDQQ